MPDVIAGRIITDVFRPAFRANNYAGGLNAAVDQLTARIKGENLALPKLEEPGWQEGGGGGEAVFGGLLYGAIGVGQAVASCSWGGFAAAAGLSAGQRSPP